MQEHNQIPYHYASQLAKLNELMRMYRVIKRQNKAAAFSDRVKTKCNQIFASLQSFSQFEPIHSETKEKMNKMFDQAKSFQSLNVRPPKSTNMESQKDKKLVVFSSGSLINEPSKPMKIEEEKANTVYNQKTKKSPQLISTPFADVTPQPSFSQFPMSNPPYQTINNLLKTVNAPPLDKTPENNLFSSDKLISINSISIEENNPSINIGRMSSISSIDSVKSSYLIYNEQMSFTDLNKKRQTQAQIEEQEQKVSEQFSLLQQNIIDNITNFCSQNKNSLNSNIIFNDDLFPLLRETDGDFIYLFGVNKPDNRKINKLYACTLMKFSTLQIYKGDDRFDKEIKDFNNSIRTPVGLIIQGQDSKAIQPEHVKFLVNIQSPFPIILVLKSYKGFQGTLCTIHQAVFERIRNTPKKQLSQCSQDLTKKLSELPFDESNFSKEKTKYVITKYINRAIPTIAQQAPNAITISDNECIRQQKYTFTYKLHTKFLTVSRPEFCIYYTNNNCINARMDLKNFQHFKKQALQCQLKAPAIFSVSVTRDIAPIRKEFFQLLLECADRRDPYAFINLSNLNLKKTVIVTLKKDVNMEMIQSIQPAQYKNYEKDTPLTYCINIITKANIKQFESETKNDMITVQAK